MTYAVVAAFGVLFALAYVGMLRQWNHERREHARERQLLINQILHLTGKTWTPPPAETWQPPADEDRGRYVAIPEQMPDDEDWERDR